MVISEELESYFKNEKPDILATIKEAEEYLKKFNLWSEFTKQVAKIIKWSNILDISNPEVDDAIAELSEKVNRWIPASRISEEVNNFSI